MNSKTLLFTVISMTFLFTSCGPERRENFTTLDENGDIVLSKESKSVLDRLMVEYESCMGGDRKECKDFISYALCEFYQIDDFKKGEVYIPYHEIPKKVENPLHGWKLLGYSEDQDVLDNAQKAANAGDAVIAFEEGKEYGHVAIILPGEQRESGKWGLKVPNSAGFFSHKTKGYVDERLSYSFRKGKKVVIYRRDLAD